MADFSESTMQKMRIAAWVLAMMGFVVGVFAASQIVPEPWRSWCALAVSVLSGVSAILAGKLPNAQQLDAPKPPAPGSPNA